MASESQSSQPLTLKLLYDSRTKKVLFAEAGKDFVDFLLTLLSLPVGTVIRLLSSNNMVGSLGKLYDSFEDLNDTYIQPNVVKDSLLNPKSSVASSSILRLTNDTSFGDKRLFYCATCRSNGRGSYGSDDNRAVCPQCGRGMTTSLTYVAPPLTQVGSTSEGGFVKGVVTYMIMDDLEVKPMSTISGITILNTFNVKEVGALKEKVVSVSMVEGLKLLKASLTTNNVLTSVFLAMKVRE